jgi:hypothetical protein
MWELPAKYGARIAIKHLPSLGRRFYPQAKLTTDIRIRVRDDGDGIAFNCGELPSVKIWLRIANYSPLKVEIDRLFGHVYCGGQLAAIQDLQQRVIPASSELDDILIEAHLTDGQAEYVRKNHATPGMKVYLSLSGLVKSTLHTYQLPFREINTNNVSFSNCEKAE